MEPTNDEALRGRGLKNLGAGRQKPDDNQQDEAQVSKNTSVWDIYNEYSRKVDNEQIRDWNDTLNTLLIFAALYSAVLTAFIIQSLTLIQEDTSESTRDILLHISNQLYNSSSLPFNTTSSSFVAPQWALRVNYCFFVSLCCSLVTALAAVLALQWVGSYDRGLNPSSVEQRALQRQFRRDGATHWKMEPIIASLPTLIFIALLIFFVGLAEWMWNVNRNVAITVVVGTAIGALFYIATTLVSIYSVGAPFRTPVSRYLPQVIGVTLGAIAAPFKRTHQAFSTGNNSKNLSSFKKLMRRWDDQQPWFWYSLRIAMQRTSRFLSPLFPFEPFEAREIKAVDGVNNLKSSSLFWLSRIISIEPYQRQTFVTILQAILDMSQGEESQSYINVDLWKPIFIVLRAPYNINKDWKDYTPEELDGTLLIMRGLTSVRMGLWKREELRPLIRKLYKGYANLDRLADIIASWQGLILKSMKRAKKSKLKLRLKKVMHGDEASRKVDDDIKDPEKESPEDLPTAEDRTSSEISHEIMRHEGSVAQDGSEHPPDMVLTIYEYTLHEWKRLPPEFLIVSLKNLNSDYFNQSQLSASGIFQPISDNLSIRPDEISIADIVPLQVLDMLQELIIVNLSKTPPSPTNLQTYLNSLHTSLEHEANELVISTYAAILQQTMANLRQINDFSPSNRPNVHDILSRIFQMVQSTFWSDISESWATPLLDSMAEPGISIWERENQTNSANLMAIALDIEWEPRDLNWKEWWIEIMLGLDAFIKGHGGAQQALFIKHGTWLLLANLPGREYFSDREITRLRKISHTGALLFAMTITKSKELALSVLSSGPGPGSDELWTPSEAWTTFIDHCYHYFEKNGQVTELFSRAFTIGSSPELYDRIYRENIVQYMESTPDLYQYLRSPVLPAVLRHSRGREDITWEILAAICSHEGFYSEFLQINGLEWLCGFISERPIRLKDALGIIHKSVIRCSRYKDLVEWIRVSHKCAETCTAAIRDGKATSRQLWQSIAPNAHLLMDQFMKKSEDPFKQRGILEPSSQGRANSNQDSLLSGKEDMTIDSKIEEWTQEEKEEFKSLVDKFTQEIDQISLGHLINQYLSVKSSLPPESDLSFLRKSTMEKPETALIYIYHSICLSFPSSTVAFSYLCAPVLEKLLHSTDKDRLMKTLVQISRYSWFRDEFIEAKGPRTLALIIANSPEYLEEAIGVVNSHFPLATTPSSILYWLNFARDCFNSVGQAISDHRNYEGRKETYQVMMSDSEGNMQDLREMITKSMYRWTSERLRLQIGRTFKGNENDHSHESNTDARKWTLNEWKEIRSAVEELIRGLQRGFIMSTKCEGYDRLPRDPDGECSLTPSVPKSIRAEPTLFERERMLYRSPRYVGSLGRLPRDPGDMCSHLH